MFKFAILAVLLCAPLFSQAKTWTLVNGTTWKEPEYEYKLFKLPTGIYWWSHVLVQKAEAAELTLKEEIEMFIKSYAQQYGSSAYELMEVADCESGYKKYPEQAIKAIGDHGNSYGLFQYHINPKTGADTFKKFKTEAGLLEHKRTDWKNQAEVSAWAFSQGEKYKDDWSCWVKLFD